MGASEIKLIEPFRIMKISFPCENAEISLKDMKDNNTSIFINGAFNRVIKTNICIISKRGHSFLHKKTYLYLTD
jgi:hypothetical protein